MRHLGVSGWFLVLVLLAEGAFVSSALEFETGLAHLLPDSRDQQLANLSAQFVDSPLTRTMVLSVGAEELPQALAAMRDLASSLRPHPEVASIRLGPDPDFLAELQDLYFPRRWYFISSDPESLLGDRLSDAGISGTVARLRRSLALPQGEWVRALAPEDPLLLFSDLTRRFERSVRSDLSIIEGQFAVRDNGAGFAVAFLETAHSAFDATAQAPFQAFLAERFAAVETSFPGVVLERSAVHRFAIESEERARADMTRISILSLVGVVCLFLLVLRSARLLVLGVIPLIAGVLTASAVALLFFGRLHVITLAFGATLIGVCLDYPIHLVSHWLLSRVGAADGSVRGAIRIGALTTAAGFAGLIASDIPGIREIGVFAASGVLAALVTTLYGLPPLLRGVPLAAAFPSRLAVSLSALFTRLRRRRGVLLAVLVAAGLTNLVGLGRLTIDDDVYGLGFAPNAEWIAEDERVRDRVALVEASHFIVALGRQEEEALQRNDAVFLRLEAAVRDGELEAFRSLHPFLPSAALQLRNLEGLRSAPQLEQRLERALSTGGFRPEAFAPLPLAEASGLAAPLRPSDFAGTSLEGLVAPFRLDLGDQFAVVTFLRGVRDPAGLEARVSDLAGVGFVDQRSLLRRAYQAARLRASQLAAVGLIGVFLLLFFHYRSARDAFLVLLPALLAATTTLSLLALFSVSVTLLHLLALLLVLSIGVDYGVFLSASWADGEARAASLFSILIASLSTQLAFGLLAFSTFPALRPLGVTTGIGVLLSALLAPAVSALFDRKKRGVLP